MSVLAIVKFQGDTAKFRAALTDRADEFKKIADTAQTSGGGIHHRFAVGDGVVVEWEQREIPEPGQPSRDKAAGSERPPDATTPRRPGTPEKPGTEE